MANLTGRRLTPEMMDAPDADRDELRRALGYLRRLNARFGGVKATTSALEDAVRKDEPDGVIRILDIGTGLGDIPVAIATWAQDTGRRVHVTAVDAHETTLALAREHVGVRDDIDLVCADARRLTDLYEPGSFDIAHASLFLHHLQDIEVLTVLRIMDRLSTRGVIWNDLVRSRLSSLLAGVGTMRAPEMVRHDAIVSVQAGFTKRETLDVAKRVGLENVRYRSILLYRFVLTAGPQ